MKISILLASLGISLLIMSRKQKKKDTAFELFNEGVRLNLLSIEEQNKGNFEKAALLNKQSIEKFRKTLEQEPDHAAARSALAHSLYIDREFSEAIYWFEQATKTDINNAFIYKERGLCKINIGKVPAGKVDIDKAFSINTTKEFKEHTIQDICDIADLAFNYGEEYSKQGDTTNEKEYKKFSIGLLILAFEYGQSKTVALKVSMYADKFGDKETALKYQELAEK